MTSLVPRSKDVMPHPGTSLKPVDPGSPDSALIDFEPWPVPTEPPKAGHVVYVNRPVVNVQIEGPGSTGVIGVALLRATCSIPVTVVTGLAWMAATVLSWIRREVPGEGARIIVTGGLVLMVAGWAALALMVAPWRTFAALAVAFGAAGAYRRLVGERGR